MDCFTSWCPQCKAVAPKIDELNKEFGDEKKVLWFKMNIEEVGLQPPGNTCQPAADKHQAEDVANEYGVSAVPTFMLFKDGDMLPEEKISGPHHQKVRAMIEKNLK